MRKWLHVTAWIFCCAVFLTGVFQLLNYYTKSKHNEHETERLSAQTWQSKDPTVQMLEQPPMTPLEKYGELFSQNNDMIGWLYIEGTPIDYPVMQTPDNPDFYLKRNFNREYSDYGTLYTTEKCSINPPSDNILIHGHHMKDGQMFGSLEKYKAEFYYKEHPTIQFDTLESFGEYRIIAVFRSVPYRFPYYDFINAQNSEEFDAFVKECQSFSFYDTGETARYGDKLLTLSTCEYSEEDSRLVIVAKRV